jgi:hypothetical protein
MFEASLVRWLNRRSKLKPNNQPISFVGPGRARTCDQTVMSYRISDAIVDFVVFSLEIDLVRCVPVRSFLVRNWCGPWSVCGAHGVVHEDEREG